MLSEEIVCFLFVLFGYVEGEGSKAEVLVLVVLSPDYGSSYGCEQTCIGFTEFYVGDINGCDCGGLRKRF